MSNTDPIGTQGATKIGDLQVAFEGDDSFANRLKDLVSTKAAAERALKDLNLGKEVKAAYAEARVATAAALAGAAAACSAGVADGDSPGAAFCRRPKP